MTIIKNRPLCRQCGTAIARYTTSVEVTTNVGENPVTIDQVSKLMKLKPGEEVLSFRRFKPTSTHVYCYVWDGKSYVDDLFCTNRCAILFGCSAARGGEHSSVAYADALNRQQGRKVK
jgi:hypothetical protein